MINTITLAERRQLHNHGIDEDDFKDKIKMQ
jgi:hypothetical protein